MCPFTLLQWPQGIGQPALLDWKSIQGLNFLSNAREKDLSRHHGDQEILHTDEGREDQYIDWLSIPWWLQSILEVV
jgi:hypothetical protein